MASKKIRIVWWNVQNFGAPYEETNKNPSVTKAYDSRRLDTIVELMSAIKPDVFVLQEVVGGSQSLLPFQEIFKLRDLLKNTTLKNGLLYPQFLGQSGKKNHSMLVFFNPNKLEPTHSLTGLSGVDMKQYVQSQSGNGIMGSKRVTGKAKAKDSGSPFTNRYPILSPFKIKGSSKLLNVYSIHAKNPANGTDAATVRENEISTLCQLATPPTEDESINVIGGDFNGLPPTNISDKWKNCFDDPSSKMTGSNYTNNIRDESWTLEGQYPAYGYLKNNGTTPLPNGLDQILVYKNVTTTGATIRPWIVNPVVGSIPNPSTIASEGTSKYGYFQPTTGGAMLMDKLRSLEATEGVSSWLKGKLQEIRLKYHEASKLKSADKKEAGIKAATDELNQLQGVRDLMHISDHFPVAIDIVV